MTPVLPNISPTTSSKPKLPPSPSFDQTSRATPPTRRTLAQTQTHVPQTKSIASIEIVEGQYTNGKIIEEVDTDGTRDLPFNLTDMY